VWFFLVCLYFFFFPSESKGSRVQAQVNGQPPGFPTQFVLLAKFVTG
jgi:hypothetical protein